MLSNAQIQRLIKSVELTSERDNDSSSLRKVNSPVIDINSSAPIISYLKNPYENGYWELKATWNHLSPFSCYLLEKADTLAELNSLAPLPPSPTLARKLSEAKREELLRITSRISSVHRLFRTAVIVGLGGAVPRLPESDAWIASVDFNEFRDKFKEAYDIFAGQIYFDGFLSATRPLTLFQIKSGAVLFSKIDGVSSDLRVVGAQLEDIQAIQSFLSSIEIIKAPKITRIFAPDEALFRPYFSMVSAVLPWIIDDAQISKIFAQALEYYEAADFQHCISTLGLISEDYLQRIYTTLLREQIPGGLTLGQIFDRLHRRVEELFPTSKVVLASLDGVFKKINEIDPVADADSLKTALRDMISIIKNDRAHYTKKIDDFIKPQARQTPFPSRTIDGINEILKWRNAASHNSRVPLGAHEADRTLYCIVIFIDWWQSQSASLDWSRTKLEIMEHLIKVAKSG